MPVLSLLLKFIVIMFIFDLSVANANRRISRDKVAAERDGVTNVATRIRNYRSNNFAGDDDIDEKDLLSEYTNLSTNGQNTQAGHRKHFDPKGSWLTFVNRMAEKPEKTKKKRKRNKKSNDKILLGPTGPPGPPGPPGSSISKEEILAELQDLIKESVERRTQELLNERLMSNSTIIIPFPEMASQLMTLPRIYAGFTMRLSVNTKVRRKTFMELQTYQQPFGGGAFQRGEVFNAREGRFLAPRDGVYQFTANLHLRVKTKRKLKGKPKADEHLKLVICIDSLCKTNTCLITITGINIDYTTLSAAVNGILHLKEKQYTSLYVDNSSSYNVIVLAGSEFSGIFIGV